MFIWSRLWNRPTTKAFASAAFILATSAQTGAPEAKSTASSAGHEMLPDTTTRFDASFNASYTAPGEARFAGARFDDSDAFALTLGIRASRPINETWGWTAGVRSENFYLDQISLLPIPDSIHTLGISVGPTYQINERWKLSANFGPSLYRVDDVESDTIGFSGSVLAAWRQSPNLRWNFGFAVNPDSDIKVFPAVGVQWNFKPDWTLDLGVPRTRLTYKLTPAWQLHTGLDMVGTTFRANRDLDSEAGVAGYNNALATYRDLRYGVGTALTVHKALTLDLEAGASVYRRVDYTRLDREVRFSPAPFVRAGVAARF